MRPPHQSNYRPRHFTPHLRGTGPPRQLGPPQHGPPEHLPHHRPPQHRPSQQGPPQHRPFQHGPLQHGLPHQGEIQGQFHHGPPQHGPPQHRPPQHGELHHGIFQAPLEHGPPQNEPPQNRISQHEAPQGFSEHRPPQYGQPPHGPPQSQQLDSQEVLQNAPQNLRPPQSTSLRPPHHSQLQGGLQRPHQSHSGQPSQGPAQHGPPPIGPTQMGHPQIGLQHLDKFDPNNKETSPDMRHLNMHPHALGQPGQLKHTFTLSQVQHTNRREDLLGMDHSRGEVPGMAPPPGPPHAPFPGQLTGQPLGQFTGQPPGQFTDILSGSTTEPLSRPPPGQSSIPLSGQPSRPSLGQPSRPPLGQLSGPPLGQSSRLLSGQISRLPLGQLSRPPPEQPSRPPLGTHDGHHTRPPRQSETSGLKSQAMSGISKLTADQNTSRETGDGEVNKLQQQAEDVSWVQAFCASRLRKPQRQDAAQEFTIPRARALLREAVHLKEQLHQQLAQAQTEDVGEQFAAVKRRLSVIENTFKDEQLMSKLKARINRVKKKRAGIRRRRQQAEAEQQQTLDKRRQVEEEIDQWQANLIRKAQDEKKAGELKRAVDAVLTEVSRKQLETTRGLDLLESLAKLRDVRRMKAEQKGVYTTSTSDDLFSCRLHRSRGILERQSVTYAEENKTLRVMVDMEQEETKEKEREAEKRKEHRKLRAYGKNVKMLLFGKQDLPDHDDPLYNHRMYHEVASHSLEDFIQIRRAWDVFAVRSDMAGSRPPVGWVTPVAPSSYIWQTALEDYQAL